MTQERDFAARAAEDRLVMAVAVDKNVRAVKTARDEAGRAGGEKVGKKPDLLAHAFGAGIAGEKFEELVLEYAGATGLEKNKGQAGIDLRSHAAENLREIGARRPEQAEVVERTAAADVTARGFYAEAGEGENGFRSLKRLRMVVVVPGVGPQEHLRCGSLLDEICGRVSRLLEALWREARQLPLAGDAGNALDEWAGDGACEDGVGESRRERAVAGETVGKSENVVVERVRASLVALGEELGFAGRHVDLHRALGFAGLATEAKIEGLVDGAALKAFLAQGPGKHLPKQVRAAAGGVLLLAGGAVTGAHDAARGIAAGADAHATFGGTN